MKIFLGLYVINYNSNEIGSLIINNNLSSPIKYELKNNSESNFLDEKIFNNLIKLEKEKNIEIKFKLNKFKLLTEGIANTKFIIHIYNNNILCDSCEVDLSIYIINLVLKISLNNEKFTLKENIIYINNHIPELTISYELPGHRLPKLGIYLKTNDKNKLDIDFKNEGKGKIICNYKDGDSVKYNFSLILNKELINFEVDYEKPTHFG